MYPIIATIVFVHPVPIALMHGSAPADAPAAKIYLTKLLMAICDGGHGVSVQFGESRSFMRALHPQLLRFAFDWHQRGRHWMA